MRRLHHQLPPSRGAFRPPQVVAHRGDSDAEPEHTLAAYRRAIEVGADALECDVRLSADGHLVCLHDRTVDRTSNGTGLVSTLRLTELKDLDWGSWRRLTAAWPEDDWQEPGIERDLRDRRDLEPDGPDERSQLLTLHQLLALIADSRPGIELAIETKHPTRYGGLVERRLVETLDRFGWARPRSPARSPIRVMSFSPLALRRMRQLAPSLPLVLLADRMLPPMRDGSLPKGVGTAGIAIEVLRTHPDLPHRLHEHGHAVHVWTVDEPVDVDRCLDAGVEAVITNRPALVLRQLGRTAPLDVSGGGGAVNRPENPLSRVGEPSAGQTGQTGRTGRRRGTGFGRRAAG